MITTIPALASGFLFGIGLAISGMTNPAVVLGFLDITGHWNPALAMVMLGALMVTLPGMVWMRRRKPVFSDECQWPSHKDIDSPLVVGAAMFGLGWGISGLCPGPALAGLALAPNSVGLFVAAMIAGMALHSFYQRWWLR